MGDNRSNGANLGAWYVQANNVWSNANGNNWSARQPLEKRGPILGGPKGRGKDARNEDDK